MAYNDMYEFLRKNLDTKGEMEEGKYVDKPIVEDEQVEGSVPLLRRAMEVVEGVGDSDRRSLAENPERVKMFLHKVQVATDVLTVLAENFTARIHEQVAEEKQSDRSWDPKLFPELKDKQKLSQDVEELKKLKLELNKSIQAEKVDLDVLDNFMRQYRAIITEKHGSDHTFPQFSEYRFDSKYPPGKFESFSMIFMDKVPADKHEATVMVERAWQGMSPKERMRYFPNLNKEICEMDWESATQRGATTQTITENLFVRTFGDHKPPYSFR